jgi:hypothetical protein
VIARCGATHDPVRFQEMSLPAGPNLGYLTVTWFFLTEQGWDRGVEPRTSAKEWGPPTEQALGLGGAPHTFASNLSQPNDPDHSLRGVTSGLVPKRLGLVSKAATCGILARSWPE